MFALRQIDRFGSVASNRYGAGGRGMSASPPIATKFMLGCERRDVPIATYALQQTTSLFDHKCHGAGHGNVHASAFVR